MRLLAEFWPGSKFSSKLTGDNSLQKRPMKRVIGPLREMGADIRARDDNFAPLEIRGAKLKAIDYIMPMASAQVKSAVLLAGLFADGVTGVTEPARTRDHTELALEEFGAPSRKTDEHSNSWPRRRQRQRQTPREIPRRARRFVFAVFFYRRGIPVPRFERAHSQCRIESDQDSHLDVFASMGASIQILGPKDRPRRSVGDFSSERFLAKGAG